MGKIFTHEKIMLFSEIDFSKTFKNKRVFLTCKNGDSASGIVTEIISSDNKNPQSKEYLPTNIIIQGKSFPLEQIFEIEVLS